YGHNSLATALLAEGLDLDVDADRKLELHQGVDRLRRRLEDVEQTLVGPHLELLTRLLVDVRRAVDGVAGNRRRAGDRSRALRPGPPRRVDDLARRLVEDPVVEGLEPNADLVVLRHGCCSLNSYGKKPLFDDLDDGSGADGTAAFADGEAQALLHGDGRDQV